MSTQDEKDAAMLAAMKSAHETNRKLHAELTAAKAEVERLKDEISNSNKFAQDQEDRLDRHKRALELALYYVEGDATYEGVKEKVSRILEGKE